MAASVGVSRQWLSAFEGGKPTVNLGLVLRVLDRLGLRLEVGGEKDRELGLPVSAAWLDLDDVLERFRNPI